MRPLVASITCKDQGPTCRKLSAEANASGPCIAGQPLPTVCGHGTTTTTCTDATTTMTVDAFSIQPWGRAAGETGALKDVLGRVNVERGHFRDINEASVQEELAGEGALALSESDQDEDEDEPEASTEPTREKPKTREELYKAKYEMLANVHAAQQEIAISLDFISLLLSKETPKLGAATMSPLLKNELPTGSLGIDMWQKMANDKAREAQDDTLATNVKLGNLKQSADSLLSAASRLQDNVRKETEYWNQVLTISEDGWNVCRIPGQKNKLAVRFGFSESAPEFSRRGIVAINTSARGRVSLERGVGRKPKALHVTLRKVGRLTGTSKLPRFPDPEETTLETRLRYARDSLYDEELYHEMVRECRALPSLGVTLSGSTIQLESDTSPEIGHTISLDLASLDEEEYGPQYDVTNADDRLAQATALIARLLLSQAHRDRLKTRSEVPPPLSDKRNEEKPPLRLLRPLLSFITHQSGLQALNTWLGNVASTLRAAKIDVASNLTSMRLPARSEIWDIDSLIRILLLPWSSVGLLTVKTSNGEETSFKITVQTEPVNTNSFTTSLTLEVPFSNSTFRFETFEAFVAAVTVMISSALAKASLAIAGEDWYYDDEEALLIRDNGVGRNAEEVEIVLDSSNRSLVLRASDKEHAWTVERESPRTGFWETMGGIVGLKDS